MVTFKTIREVFNTASVPLDSVNLSSHWMLFTVLLPEEWVTVMSPGKSSTTSSLGPGSVPELQLAGVFQSPLPPIQENGGGGEWWSEK